MAASGQLQAPPDDLPAEVDLRLAALAALRPASLQTQPGPAESGITQPVVMHYIPATADASAAPAERASTDHGPGGLFGLFRGPSVRAPARTEPLRLPSAQQLAQLANSLLAFAAQTPGSQPARSASRHLEELYQTRPIGRRVPVRVLGAEAGRYSSIVPDLVDDRSIAADPDPDQYLLLLGELIRRIRDVEGRALGAARATEIYRDAVEDVFGDPRDQLGSTQMINLVATPPRGRLTIRSGGEGGPFEIVGHAVSIGRSASNAVRLTHPTVSGRHARLAPRVEGFVIVDLGSRNGTTVDGERIEGERKLRGGEAIGVGEALLGFELLSAAGADPPQRPSGR